LQLDERRRVDEDTVEIEQHCGAIEAFHVRQ
jgi:hypothetical protein